MRRLPTIFLIFCSAVYSQVSVADTAEICADCSTEAKAQQFAKTMTNSLQCTPVFGQDVSCSSQSKVVVFVDKNSGQAYKYNVYHQPTAPWAAQAERIDMHPDQVESFRILTAFYRDVNESIIASSMSVEALLGSNWQSIPKLQNRSGTTAQSSETQATGNCPTDSALAALLDPNKLEDIQTSATVQIGTNLLSQNNQINLNPVKINDSYSLTFKGFTSNISATGTNRTPSFAATFGNTERVTSISDYLVYNVSIVGYDFQDMPIVSYTLSDASRVAGYSLGALKGQNGPLLIDNACIENRLDQAVAQGVITSVSTPIAGSGGGGGSSGTDTETGGIPTGGGGGCKIVDFFQGGQRLYTFRMCS